MGGLPRRSRRAGRTRHPHFQRPLRRELDVPFWAGVYSNELRKGRGQITVKTDAVTDDGYVWYTVATWKPGREEYFWIGVGQFDKKNGSAAVESVWVDEILIEEVEN